MIVSDIINLEKIINEFADIAAHLCVETRSDGRHLQLAFQLS
jgi:hypothetical protein